MSVEADRSKQPRLRSGRLCHCAATKVQDLRVATFVRAPSRTLTDARAAASRAVSADCHLIYFDGEYAGRRGDIALLVHGLWVFGSRCSALSAIYPDDFLASTSASCNFLRQILKNITHSARRHGYSDHAGDGAQPAT
jgi:acyl dehydratase